VLKKAVVGVLVALTLVVGSGFADLGPGIVRAQQHTEITLKPVEQVRDYYIEYATQHGWEKLNDTMREKAMAEVISGGPFVTTVSRLYTPRVLWVERMANADYYFRDFDQAEKEFYDDYYVDPADGTSIMTVLGSSNRRDLQDDSIEFIVRDSTGKVYRDWEVFTVPYPLTERTLLGITLYNVTYELFVDGDFSAVDSIELFVLVDGLVGRAEHRWILE
jgi:hypothetical protein